jgi:hypothetical protein
MSKKKRLSFADILEEERGNFEDSTPSASTDETPRIESSKKTKSDYVRLSITLAPDDFERLQQISLNRRRSKKTYTFCHLAREAITAWLDQQEEA